MEDKRTRSRFVSLDLMRILGVALVVLAHILGPRDGGRHELLGLYVLSMGGMGVTILLILSGMAIEHSYADRGLSYASFIRGRLERIYPTYWLSVLFTLAMLGASRIKMDLPDLLLDFSGFLVFTGRLRDSYISPMGWFIGLILAIYAFYPAISRLMNKRPHLTLLAILGISVLSRYALASTGFETDPRAWFPLARLFEFALGVWLTVNRPIFGFITGIGAGITRTPIGRAIKHASNLTFPMYLIHWAALRTPYNQGSLVFALIMALLGSEVVFRLDRYISKRVTSHSHTNARNLPRTPEMNTREQTGELVSKRSDVE